MWSNTKLLITFSLTFITAGLGLLLVGLKPQDQPLSIPNPTPLMETTSVATSSAVVGIEGERVLVTKVIDGDTFEISDVGGFVRMIGVGTPETIHPRKPVECFGKEASNRTKNLLNNKTVILQKDVSDKDKYGRLLRYVFLPLDDNQTLFVNDYLIREGFAKVLTYPPDVKYNEQFLDAQRESKEKKLGLWGRC